LGELQKRIEEKAYKESFQTDKMTVLKLVVLVDNVEKIVEEMMKDIPKPRLSWDYGLDPEAKCKYWVIPTHKEWMMWLKKWLKNE